VAVSRERTCVILPAKQLDQAKTRLRASLSESARAALARDMFLHVLDAALECPRVEAAYVVTNGDDVAALARTRERAHVLRDPRPDMTLAELMDWALRELRDFTHALIVMADIPTLEARDLDALCDALATADCVLVPDRRGQSTNALGLRLPSHGHTAFGQPDSLTQHHAMARARGLRVRILGNVRIAHDVDIPDDLPAGPEVAGKLQGW
jgi:2-phospho-L-lactate/phosphoenolpyruvate guanylyltransferase